MNYSQADLLGEELYLSSGEATLKHRILYKLLQSKKVPLKLNIPHVYLSRASILCEDIERITEEKIDEKFLLEILIQDFVNELAGLHAGPAPAFQFLLDRYTKPLKVAHYQSKQVDEFEMYEKKKQRMIQWEVEVRTKEVRRLEWFLYDLEDHVNGHGFTVEMVLEILFCYLIELVKKGEAEKAIKEIIRSITQS